MKIIYVHSYPVYHDMLSNCEFLQLDNRDKWMPALTIQNGADAELWVASKKDDDIFPKGYGITPNLAETFSDSSLEETNKKKTYDADLNPSKSKASYSEFNNYIKYDIAGHNGPVFWRNQKLPVLPIRVFETDQKGEKIKSRNHTSVSLNQTAYRLLNEHGERHKTYNCKKSLHTNAKKCFFVIIGMDGGIGVYLAQKVLIPQGIPFGIIIGGEWYHKIAKSASLIFYETEWQRHMLAKKPGLRLNNNKTISLFSDSGFKNLPFSTFLREKKRQIFSPAISTDKLSSLPKSVNTNLFTPLPDINKEYDVIAMGRLIDYYKNYNALFELSRHVRIGFIGGGPMLESYRIKHRQISWFGHVPHSEVSSYLNRGKLFFHSSLRDHFPRVIAEAAACGVPPMAFKEAIGEDVINSSIGLLLSRKNFIGEIKELLGDSNRLFRLSQNTRAHAEKYWHMGSCEKAISTLMCQ